MQKYTVNQHLIETLILDFYSLSKILLCMSCFGKKDEVTIA